MKIEKGNFKYNDSVYSVCYAVVADTKYYFASLDDSERLLNDNRIVSTELLEVLNPSNSSCHFGIIDNNGNEIIACSNRNIFKVNDYLLFIEPSSVKSSFIQNNINSRNDPGVLKEILATNASIMSLLKNKVGASGKILFANPCSEATVVDSNGDNLINDNYYSYIAISDKFIYFVSFNNPSVVDGFAIDYNLGSDVNNMQTKINELEEKCELQTQLISEYSEKIVQLNNKIKALEKYCTDIQAKNKKGIKNSTSGVNKPVVLAANSISVTND